MTPDAVAAATTPLRPAVLSAFRKALIYAFGNDPRAVAAAAALDTTVNDTNTSTLPEHQPDIAAKKLNESAEAAALSFADLLGVENFVPVQDLTTFSWAESQSRAVLEQFNASVNDQRKAIQAEKDVEAQKAIARAAAAGANSTHQTRSKTRTTSNPNPTYNSDPVVWAAQQESAAAAVLRELRTNLSKLKKASSKTSAEGSPFWSLLSQRNSKMNPHAAAEMARARVAAAAAVAAMRQAEPEGQLQVADSLQNNPTSPTTPEHDKQFHHVVQHFSGLQLSPRPSSTRFYPTSHSHDISSTHSPYPEPPSLESGARFKTVSKKKRVEFAEGTVFYKRR